MSWSVFYASIAVLVFILAMAVRHVTGIKFALLMILSAAATNMSIAALGFERAPMLIAPINGVIALMLAGEAFKVKSVPGAAIFALFILEMFIHFAGFVTHATGKHGYWVMLNVIFFAQVAINGVSGVFYGHAHRLDRGHRHAGPLVLGR